jgi:hypothetical protein
VQINKTQWAGIPRSDDTESRVCVRMLVFAPKTVSHANERTHLDLQRVLDFAKHRMRPGEPCAPYRGPFWSPWRGCTRFIVEIFDESHSRSEVLATIHPHGSGSVAVTLFTNTVPLLMCGKRFGKACPVTVFQLRFHDVSATVTCTGEGKACSWCADSSRPVSTTVSLSTSSSTAAKQEPLQLSK